MSLLSRFGLVAAIIAVLPSMGASPLMYSIAGKPKVISWPASAFPIGYTIDRRVADAFGAATVEKAFDAWAAVPEASITFKPAAVGDGIRAAQDGVNTLSMAGGLFANQGFIAVTTNWHDALGNISEADIQIDASAGSGSYSVQAMIEHEVGHLLGLDHSAVLSSVMYPYVSRTSPTNLDSDDTTAISALYPNRDQTFAGATIRGKVVGNEGGIFAAQVVALNDNGEPVATGLTASSGEFVLQGVPDGVYRIYAEPLDGPVGPRNLDGIYRDAKVTSFPTTFASSSAIRVASGNVYGNLVVNSGGAPVQLNPQWIGTAASGSSDFTMNAATVDVKPGQTFSLAVGGDGFTSGMTTFEVMNPGVQRISDFRYAANFAFASFHVSDTASNASAVILVTSGNQSATLTGGLRIVGSTGARTRVARK